MLRAYVSQKLIICQMEQVKKTAWGMETVWERIGTASVNKFKFLHAL